MAVVIHTRKGKYQYAYEHTREGDKVISRYMYPVNKEGDKIKQYQREVAQHGWDKVTEDVYEKGDNLFIQKGYNPQTNKYIISYGDKSHSKTCKTKIVNTEKEADDFIKQYIGKKKVAQQPEQKEVAQQSVSISRIFCDKCKKPFYYQTSIMNKGITVYRNNGIITGYSFKHKRPIKKISGVSGVPVEKEVYTLKFYCKKCYSK